MECPAMRKLKHGSVHPKGSRGRAESPLVAAAAAILPAPIKVKKQECALRRGGGGERKAPPRSRRSEIPAFRKRAAMSERPATRSRPFGATMCRRLVERLGGARLRTREVTGRDASLPAPLLAVSLELVARKTVGALPQTPQGTLSLDPARGRRKGTKSPLDPFRAIELVALSYFFRVLVPFSPSLP